jgi:hypothetical protein
MQPINGPVQPGYSNTSNQTKRFVSSQPGQRRPASKMRAKLVREKNQTSPSRFQMQNCLLEFRSEILKLLEKVNKYALY